MVAHLGRVGGFLVLLLSAMQLASSDVFERVRAEYVEQVDDEVVRLTVATRFLRNWLRSHYYDFVLRLSRGEWPTVERLEFSVRQPHFSVEAPKEAPRIRSISSDGSSVALVMLMAVAR